MFDLMFQVVTSRPLDRERTPFYTLQVRCQDAGIEPQTSETSIQVNVVDINDNSPVFSAQTYRGTLVENNYIGASVLQASQEDQLVWSMRQHDTCALKNRQKC